MNAGCLAVVTEGGLEEYMWSASRGFHSWLGSPTTLLMSLKIAVMVQNIAASYLTVKSGGMVA